MPLSFAFAELDSSQINLISDEYKPESSHRTTYNDLSKYVNTQYNKALDKDKKRNVAFAHKV